MANEFKVKKGLIVEGSGSIILDVQGSQGQLFSITDSLTGDIFSVSDISGIPIFNINSDGTGTQDGNFNVTGNITASGSNSTITGSLYGNSSTSTKLETARTIAGVSFDGSTNISLNNNAITNGAGYTTNTGTVTGTGTTNYLPKFTGTSTLGNSLVYDDGTNVGIGTTSPAQKLDVNGIIQITNLYKQFTFASHNTYGNLIIDQSGGTSAGIIINDGRLGVNTGNINLGSQAFAVKGFGATSATTNLILQNSAASTLMTVLDDGNVGIGTTSPTEKLHVDGNSLIHNTSGQVTHIVKNNTGQYVQNLINSSNAYYLTGGTTDIRFDTKVTPDFAQLVLDTGGDVILAYSTGNVGIGTAPSAKLDVAGDTHIDGNMRLRVIADSSNISRGINIHPALYNGDQYITGYGNSGGGGLKLSGTNTGGTGITSQIFLDPGSGIITFGTGTSGQTERMRLSNTGNVGIGTTSPDAKLHINTPGNADALVFSRDTYGEAGVIKQEAGGIGVYSQKNLILGADEDNQFTGGSSNVIFTTDGSEKMRIDSSGNVGIGTTSPSAKLEVNGALFVGDHTGTITPTDGIWIEGANGNETQIQMYSLNGSVFHVKNAATKATIGYGSSQNRSVNFTNTGAGDISVGIGTDSPENLLHVQQSGLYTGNHATAGIRIKSDGAAGVGNYHGTIALSKGTGSVAIAAVQEATDSDVMGMAFFTHPSGTGGDASVEKMRIDQDGNVGIGTTTPQSKLQVDGGIQMADDTDTASATKVGTMRYRTLGNNSYVDMCMQTGITTYEWVNIVQNNW